MSLDKQKWIGIELSVLDRTGTHWSINVKEIMQMLTLANQILALIHDKKNYNNKNETNIYNWNSSVQNLYI